MLKTLAFSTGIAAFGLPVFANDMTYDFQGFQAIQVEDTVTVQVTTGAAFSIRAEAEPDVLDQMSIALRDGALSISRDRPWAFGHSQSLNDITVYVSLPSLEWLGASGGADLRVTGGQGADLTLFAASDARIHAVSVAYATIDADVRNGAQVSLSGSCGFLQGESHQGAVLDALMMDCARAKTVATSGGVVTLNGTLAQMEDLDPWDEEDGLSEDVFAWDDRTVAHIGLLY